MSERKVTGYARPPYELRPSGLIVGRDEAGDVRCLARAENAEAGEFVTDTLNSSAGRLEAVENLLGLFDNPIYRRRLAGNPLYGEAIRHARRERDEAKGEKV